MGRKGISYDRKLEAVEKYKRGEGSQKSIAREYGVQKASVQQWNKARGCRGLLPLHYIDM